MCGQAKIIVFPEMNAGMTNVALTTVQLNTPYITWHHLAFH